MNERDVADGRLNIDDMNNIWTNNKITYIITNVIYETECKSPLCEGLSFFFLQIGNRVPTNIVSWSMNLDIVYFHSRKQ